MVVCVVGPRVWSASAFVGASLAALAPSSVLVGCAAGVDALSVLWCRSAGVPVRVFVARWAALGRRAGFVRSAALVAAAPSSSLLLCFVPVGSAVLSVGSALSVRLARRAGLSVRFVSPVAPFRLVS